MQQFSCFLHWRENQDAYSPVEKRPKWSKRKRGIDTLFPTPEIRFSPHLPFSFYTAEFTKRTGENEPSLQKGEANMEEAFVVYMDEDPVIFTQDGRVSVVDAIRMVLDTGTAPVCGQG
jgi:hypothetical protein